jgi:iron complex outermembrane receptor protein
MANHSPFLKATRVHAAVALCIASCASAWAQQNPTEITITEQLPARVSGFGDVPAHELPFNTTIITNSDLQDIGAQRVSDALRLDASVTDSYNSPAFWDMLSVRGYTLNNRYNYQREGLPISAETMIPMDNKERIELLKGTSGMQAGTSAPGGLVNYVVKRAPTNAEQPIRNITLSFGQGNNKLVAADLGGRFGNTSEFGYRFNVAYEDLNPYIKDTKGHRDLVALAMDWRINADSKLEWEFENSHREQIGVNAYSLIGNSLPPTVDGTRNITRQNWSQPGVYDAFTGSVRLKQNLNNGWLWTTQYGSQYLRSDDRLAFAFGCTDGSNYSSDRYCSNGNFDVYDYRSNNEKRYTEAIQTEVSGQSEIAGLKHNLTFSVMRQRQLDHMPSKRLDDAYAVGTVNMYNDVPVSIISTTPETKNTNRNEYGTELSVKDKLNLTAADALWLGLKHTIINRSSVRTDGSRQTNDERSVNTTWLAFTHQLDASKIIYASYGEGLELNVTPNKNYFTNAGAVLPAQRSHQQEFGIKGQTSSSHWQAAWFDITRPVTADGPNGCDPYSSTPVCTRQMDGEARHRGLELSGNTHLHNWTFGSGLTWIDAKRQNSVVDPSLNGQRPINVPSYVLRAMTEYRYSSVPGLRTGLRLSREGERYVTETGDIKLPAWTTFDASAHYDTKISHIALTWSLAIDNLTDKHYWRESPKQYEHYYLYPGAPRTLRASVQFRL